MGGLVIILVDCRVFLSWFLDFVRMAILLFYFLAQKTLEFVFAFNLFLRLYLVTACLLSLAWNETKLEESIGLH